jgi:hypothetical protein
LIQEPAFLFERILEQKINESRSFNSSFNSEHPTLYLSPSFWLSFRQFEIFDGHPTGVFAHYYLIMILNAFCSTQSNGLIMKEPETSLDCSPAISFTKECTRDYLKKNYPDKKFIQTLLLKGCSITYTEKSELSYMVRQRLITAKLSENVHSWHHSSGQSIALKNNSTLIQASEAARATDDVYEDEIQNALRINVEEDQDQSKSMPRPFNYEAANLILIALFSILAIIWSFKIRYRQFMADSTIALLPSMPRISDDCKTKSKSGFKITAINFSRYIASVHIAANHLQNKGFALNKSNQTFTYAITWGYTWVPFFFILSGFVLTYVQVSSTLTD